MNKINYIHVAIAFNDKSGLYSKHVAVTLASILKNTNEHICIHVLHDNTLSDDNKNKFISLINYYKQKIEFHNISITLKDNICRADIKRISQAALYRLLIPEIINEAKVIYLDTDIIVNLDLKYLWEEDLEKFYIGAVLDSKITRNEHSSRKFYNKININLDNYFNSGVLLLNLNKLSMYKLYDKCIAFLEQHPEAPHTDQSALNYLLQDKCKILDSRYNIIINDYSRLKIKRFVQKEGIYHFAGATKPWDGIYSEADKLYWIYLLYTPWGKRNEFIKSINLMKLDSYPLEKLIMTQRIYSKKIFLKNIFNRIYSIFFNKSK